MENCMLRKMSIIAAVLALSLTAVQTDAFARGGGGGGHGGGGGGHGGGFGGGGHFGGGGFGGGHFGGGGFGGGHFGGGRVGVARGGFASRNTGLRVRGDRGFRRGYGWGGWGWDDWCDGYPYAGYYGSGYCY
jgi:hypothetical protein